MEDYLKSIKAILYDRITSPFYGTLIISWLLWNWEIPYVTFFVSESKICGTKIHYIIENCGNLNNLLLFPLISTVFLILVIPFVSNGAFWITHKFDTWRINKRNELDNKQLLTLAHSIALRTEMLELEGKIEKQLNSKDLEIKQLNGQIENFVNLVSEKEKLIFDHEGEVIASQELVSGKDNEIKVLVQKNEELEMRILSNEDPFPIFPDLRHYLSGKWLNEYTIDGKTTKEKFELKNGNEYYINNILTFRIIDIRILYSDNFTPILEFNKHDVKNPNRNLINRIDISINDLFKGFEEGNPIQYTRIV